MWCLRDGLLQTQGRVVHHGGKVYLLCCMAEGVCETYQRLSMCPVAGHSQLRLRTQCFML